MKRLSKTKWSSLYANSFGSWVKSSNASPSGLAPALGGDMCSDVRTVVYRVNKSFMSAQYPYMQLQAAWSNKDKTIKETFENAQCHSARVLVLRT